MNMSIGDIGILQNITISNLSYLNGHRAEITKLYGLKPKAYYSVKVLDSNIADGVSFGEWEGTCSIKKHQIRPITDPDQEIEQKKEETV